MWNIHKWVHSISVTPITKCNGPRLKRGESIRNNQGYNALWCVSDSLTEGLVFSLTHTGSSSFFNYSLYEISLQIFSSTAYGLWYRVSVLGVNPEG